jgi:hypothetical protein
MILRRHITEKLLEIEWFAAPDRPAMLSQLLKPVSPAFGYQLESD